MDIKKYTTDVQILIGSVLTCFYFGLDYLLNHKKIETFLSGTFGNMISIPFVFLTVTLFLLSIYLLATKKIVRKSLIYLAILMNFLNIIYITVR